ncbi:MAG: glutaredoxin family protein [Parvimonas sp.]|jgi:glutaredoxin|nr:glutaredoxin family protein [Parvimonas sp.]DAM61791.1 MAG TPA: NrdH [Ackermannviridae sp.]DAP06160.1 MAG TPA: NrdH [Ackermannviridae sp.]DAW82226.1 MAG TPA: NrdH [Bacteriophage sp.]
MLKIYTKEDCPNCSKLKNILTKYNIEFEVVEDEKELMIIGSKSRIMSAPILELNDKFYSYIDFNNFLILFSNVLLKY